MADSKAERLGKGGGGGADLDRLLAETSRTFALSIPVLPEPTRREVTVAYLLFRIADTFEDASHWPVAARTDALARFSDLLTNPSTAQARLLAHEWTSARPSSHEGYLTLLGELPAVLDSFVSLSPRAVDPIREHVVRSASGMADFVRRTDAAGQLALADLPDLRRYCYFVAGVVGEMLTELFLLGRESLARAAPALRPRASLFGEALQLVNILRDAGGDAAEGRRYLPEGVSRADLFALARRDLGSAAEYIAALQSASAPRGILAFTALPVELAWATLERVEAEGPGAKVSRLQVGAIVAALDRRLSKGEPAVRPRLTPAG
jgi:farnesyl-diphosphate farnesyltransferase